MTITSYPSHDSDPLLQLRAEGANSKLSGYLVPWRETVTIHGRPEVFHRGAFDEWFDRYPAGGSQAKKVALNLEHNRKTPIGVLTATENRHAGQYGEFKLANTANAREAAQLVADGVLGGFSIEFKNAQPAADGSITKADLVGVGVVACPVYDGAVLTRSYNRELTRAISNTPASTPGLRITRGVLVLPLATIDQRRARYISC